MGKFSKGDPVTRVIVYLTDKLDDISAMDIQTALYEAGFHVHSVKARPNTDFVSGPVNYMGRGA